MTTSLQKEDVQRIATDLHKEIRDTQIEWILQNYSNYEEFYPTWNWTEIVELMLDDVVYQNLP